MNSCQSRINVMFKTIRKFETFFLEEFKKCDIKRCGHCGGTGLKNNYDMDNYCNYCGGVGYKGFKKLNNKFICRNCNGGGCSCCDKEGVVDWVDHLTSKDILKPKGSLI